MSEDEIRGTVTQVLIEVVGEGSVLSRRMLPVSDIVPSGDGHTYTAVVSSLSHLETVAALAKDRLSALPGGEK